MIPIIGLIVSLYSFVRLVEIISLPNRSVALKILAGLAAASIAVLAGSLIGMGAEPAMTPPPF